MSGSKVGSAGHRVRIKDARSSRRASTPSTGNGQTPAHVASDDRIHAGRDCRYDLQVVFEVRAVALFGVGEKIAVHVQDLQGFQTSPDDLSGFRRTYGFPADIEDIGNRGRAEIGIEPPVHRRLRDRFGFETRQRSRCSMMSRTTLVSRRTFIADASWRVPLQALPGTLHP